jgi:MFS family permease
MLIDRGFMSSRRFFTIALLASSLGQLLMVVPNLYGSLAIRVMHDFGDGIAGLVFNLGISRLFNVEKIGGLSSLVTFTALLSSAVGALVFSHIGELWGYQYSIVGGGLSIALVLFLITGYRQEL